MLKKCDIAQFLSFIWDMRQSEIFGKLDTYRSIDDVTDSWISIPFSHSPNKCNIKQIVTLLDFLQVLKNNLHAFLADDSFTLQWFLVILNRINIKNRIVHVALICNYLTQKISSLEYRIIAPPTIIDILKNFPIPFFIYFWKNGMMANIILNKTRRSLKKCIQQNRS